MDNSIYNSFFNATRDVFSMMLDVSDVSKIPIEEFIKDELLNISIGVVGDFKGEIIYRFPRSTSLSVVNIMSGMDFTSVDEFVTSAISEIANIISGNVLSLLASTNISCDILPPVISENNESKEYDLRSDCCIASSVGEICLDIRLNSNN